MLQSQYQKALRCFLLTKYSAAAIACVKTIALLPPSSDQSFSDISVQQIEQLRFSIWTLYLNIATTLLARDNPSTQTIELLGLPPSTATHKDQVALQVWQFLMNHYGGSGNVDPRLISTCILMTIKLQVVNAGRHIAEEWYAGLSDATMDYFAAITAQEDPQEPNVYYEGTLKALELYITQILPALKDYESAISFCEYNPLIRESNKKVNQGYVVRVKECTRAFSPFLDDLSSDSRSQRSCCTGEGTETR
ncbi:hypothetical protein BX666DRAFT_1856159 [Dichotomocladium elegans]|nr:hypothetical protein BX666DRAFT_1856159 [Dichotomocladium elegans]